MLEISKRILELYNNDEFKLIIITGDNGYGKSAYANNAIAEVYSDINDDTGNWSVSLFKKHIGFHPAKVMQEFLNKRKRDRVFHWDDAGAWLNTMDYHDKFVISFGKYLQTARTDWGAIILSALDKDDVANKIRSTRHAIIIDITKRGDKYDNRRIANAVIYYKDKWGKLRWDEQWNEVFNCHMPESFYGWYRPLRDSYSRMAKQLMKEALAKKKDIMRTAHFELDPDNDDEQ